MSSMGEAAKRGTTSSERSVEELMADIRARVSAQVAASDLPPAAKRPADFEAGSDTKAGELVSSEHLRFLNTNYAPSVNLRLEDVSSHRKGPLAKALVSFKRKVLVTVWDYLFQPFLKEEQDFRANEVRLLNRLVRYVDERDGALFWELIRKLDYDIAEIDKKVARVNEQMSGEFRSTEKTLSESQERAAEELREKLQGQGASLDELKAKQQQMDSVLLGMEGILARYGSQTEGGYHGESSEQMPDPSYLLLENRFRGSEEQIQKHLEVYAELFSSQELPGDLLEIGCGRGELLELLKDKDIAAQGIDIDPAMIDVCKEKGLAVKLGDGMAELESFADNSLGAVIAVQVVEHLSVSQLERFMKLAHAKLASGGFIVFETINPLSLRALSSNYFRDPTHVAPLHPETASYLLSLNGFEQPKVEFLSNYPAEAQLEPLKAESFMTPRFREFVEGYNRNVQRLNELCYAPQDFYACARKP